MHCGLSAFPGMLTRSDWGVLSSAPQLRWHFPRFSTCKNDLITLWWLQVLEEMFFLGTDCKRINGSFTYCTGHVWKHFLKMLLPPKHHLSLGLLSKVQAEYLHVFLHALILHMKREITCMRSCLPCGIADNAVN